MNPGKSSHPRGGPTSQALMDASFPPPQPFVDPLVKERADKDSSFLREAKEARWRRGLSIYSTLFRQRHTIYGPADQAAKAQVNMHPDCVQLTCALDLQTVQVCLTLHFQNTYLKQAECCK